MTIDYLLHMGAASGGILYLMLGLLFIALTVIVERTTYLNRLIHAGADVANAVAQLRHIDHKALAALAAEAGSLPQGAVLQAALRCPEVSDHDRLAGLLEEAILWQAPRIDKRLWVLDTIVTLAPLLGLFGTIIGMFNAFHVLGVSGAAPTSVTAGVAEALIATASGLLIAIIGLVFFNGLNNRVRLIVHQMETIKLMLVNRLDGEPARETAPTGANRLSGLARSC